jgi:glycosyltransferase involved in cell wall biosynthesis
MTCRTDLNGTVSPFFSVVIPTYNRAAMLQRAIRSVFNQTFGDFELIVVDDHSTDHTKAIVASFTDPRLRYVLNDRAKGGAGTRNAGIFRAKGEWVAFLDDDDMWLPEKLELQREKISEVDSQVGLIYTGNASYDFEADKPLYFVYPQKEGWLLNDLLYKNYVDAFSSVVIRADVLHQIGGFDERFPALQDLEMLVRAAEICKIAYVNQPLVRITRGCTDGISATAVKKLRGWSMFREKYWHLIRKDARLRHIADSRVFVFAIRAAHWSDAFRTLPWTLAGIVLDIRNILWIIRKLAHWRRNA